MQDAIQNEWDFFNFLDRDDVDFELKVYFVSEIICPSFDHISQSAADADCRAQAGMLISSVISFVATGHAKVKEKSLRTLFNLLGQSDIDCLFEEMANCGCKSNALYLRQRRNWPAERPRYFSTFHGLALKSIERLLPETA